MFKYEYFCPTSIREACELLSDYGSDARVIAGGTDLMVQIRDEDKRWSNIQCVVDLTHIDEMNFIKEEGDTIRIGAMVTHDELYKSPIIRKSVPFISDAASKVGSPQIRNRGTVGGNICNASPAADVVPSLIALDADVKVESINGSRIVPLKSIYLKANHNNLAADEIVTEIIFKKLSKETKTVFMKLGRRKALAISRINAAIAVTTDNEGKIVEARIAPGCVFPTPDRVTEAENVLIGKVATEELIKEAAKKVSEEMIKRSGVRWSTEYKKPVVEALTRRGLKQVLGVE